MPNNRKEWILEMQHNIMWENMESEKSRKRMRRDAGFLWEAQYRMHD
jgi:hypothetical protein